jgi:hypothetical protein
MGGDHGWDHSPERTTKSRRLRPTTWKSSSKPEMLRLKAGRNVSELAAYEVRPSLRPRSISYNGPPACRSNHIHGGVTSSTVNNAILSETRTSLASITFRYSM